MKIFQHFFPQNLAFFSLVIFHIFNVSSVSSSKVKFLAGSKFLSKMRDLNFPSYLLNVSHFFDAQKTFV